MRRFRSVLGPVGAVTAIPAIALVIGVMPAGGALAQEAEAATGQAQAAVETVEPFSLGAISDYSGIIERPLFSRNRRLARTAGGAAAAAIPSAANIRSGQFRLAGVIIMGDEKYALLKHEQDPEYSRVEEGTLFQDWLVEAILPGEVVLSRNGVKDKVALHDNLPSALDKRKAQRKAAVAQRVARRRGSAARRGQGQNNFVRRLSESNATPAPPTGAQARPSILVPPAKTETRRRGPGDETNQ